MQANPIFYKKIVPLDNTAHAELYLDEIEGYQHTCKTDCVYISAIEFSHIAKEYPIVFAKNNSGGIYPVAVLGLEKEKNYYVDKKGNWKANYIPAYVRRYPFILAVTEQGEDNFTVCIDEGYPGFNTVNEGLPLFNEEGKHSELLERAVGFLKDFQNHVKVTDKFCENIKKLDLLEPMQAHISLASGEKKTLAGFMGINREKLNSLKPTQVKTLLTSGHLDLILSHLSSLSIINNLFINNYKT